MTPERREEFARLVVSDSGSGNDALVDLTIRVLTGVLELVEDFTDDDECRFDHHGYCQAHSWFETDPKCPHARAKSFLAMAEVAP